MVLLMTSRNEYLVTSRYNFTTVEKIWFTLLCSLGTNIPFTEIKTV